MLRAIRFETPDYIPVRYHVNDACWHAYPQDMLCDLMEGHPFLFPGFTRPSLPYVPDYAAIARRESPFLDDWGCLWHTAEDGITGVVTRHPLSDWKDFESYQAPDPETCSGIGHFDWKDEAARLEGEKAAGRPAMGSLRHGHTFLQLCDIRGYENLLFDMVDGEARLDRLIAMIEEFNLGIVRRYLALDIDIMAYPEDLGMQKGPMLSPDMFTNYILPSYSRLMEPARAKGVPVHMHSDGDIRELADLLVSGGVDLINLQDLVNGIDWIAGRFAGKTCIELDVDRQSVTASGSPRDIDALIDLETGTLGRKEGGLMMVFGLYPGTPSENVEATMDAMERYAFRFS
ncbi:MAG: uroporphyrinogen decarboxylase family protein [Rectinemataceae bacterium]